MGQPLPLGKLTPQQLDGLLARHTFSLPGDRIVVYPGVGEDAAVIDVGPNWLVAKTDPITFATDEIGWYAVQINANALDLNLVRGAAQCNQLLLHMRAFNQKESALAEELLITPAPSRSTRKCGHVKSIERRHKRQIR